MKESITRRLASFRELMRKAGINATVIPQTDPHQSEYLADHWQVRRWLSGFTGSAGSLVVTATDALLWTDSRYFLQAAEQLEGTEIKLMKDGLPETPSITRFLTHSLVKGSTVGIDGSLFSVNDTANLRATLEKRGLLLDTTFDAIDNIWTDRPALPGSPVFIHDVKFAGEKAADKIRKILAEATEQGATSIFIPAVNINHVATSFL